MATDNVSSGVGHMARPNREVSVVVTDITERKSMEAELRESEERLRLALESGQMGMWQWDLQSNLSICNDTEYELVGLPKGNGTLDTEEFFKTVHPDDLAALHEALAETIAGRAEYLHEFRIVRPDGQVRWLAGRGRMYRDDVGRPVRMTGVNFDITANKSAEENLLRSEREAQAAANELAALMETVPALTFIALDPKCRWISCSRQTRRLLRLPEGANISFSAREGERPTNFRFMKDNRDLAPEELPLQIAVTGREVRDFEMTLLFDDGTSRELFGNVVPLFDESGKVRGAIGAFLDITERKLAEEALRDREADLALAQEVAHLGSWHWNIVENKVEWSDEMCRIYGIDGNTSDMTLEQVAALIHPDDLWKQEHALKEALAGHPVNPFEYRVVRPDGTERVVEVSSVQLEVGADNLAKGMLVIALDITDRKRTEDALKQIEWMLSAKPFSSEEHADSSEGQSYGDLTTLNRDGLILKSIDRSILRGIASEYMDLLGTSIAIYEKNGDYALGISSSNWCRLMDSASRNLCQTDDNASALASGKWLCHESCWTCCAKQAIDTGTPCDTECSGGMRLYAVPIFAGNEVIGAINFGYGEPPKDPEKVRALADSYALDYEVLIAEARDYETRPAFIIEMAKQRLKVSARLIGILIDRSRAEQQREQLLLELEAVLENINDGLVIFDLDGNILTMNKEALVLQEYENFDLVRRQISAYQDDFEMFDLEGRPIPVENLPSVRVLRGERFVDYEIRIRKKDSGKSWVASFNGTQVLSKSGNILLNVLTLRDISERKFAEEEIGRLNVSLVEHAARLADANKDIEAFNYTIAHDLRKPLTVVNGYCQALRDLCGDKFDEECKGYIQEAYDGTWRMNRLIDDLLKFSTITHTEPSRETVDISAMAHEVAKELKLAEPGRRVTFLIADGVNVDGDVGLLRVILDNLLGNAWKYTALREESIIEFGLTEIEGKPACFVRDNGVGFDMKFVDKLFVPFERLPDADEFKGHGIGLATVERIIKRHGGRIWAESESDKGSCFYFTLSTD